MPTLDFASVVRLLYPILVAVNSNLPATVPPYIKLLLGLALQVLGQFASASNIGVSGGHSPHLFGSPMPSELPPESEWTPEGLKVFAEMKAGA